MVRKYIRLSGLVQGVGFRWFVLQNAERLGLTGWVSNCEDGDLELEAQGSDDSINALIGALTIGPRYAQVERIETHTCAADKEECSFSVRDMWI